MAINDQSVPGESDGVGDSLDCGADRLVWVLGLDGCGGSPVVDLIDGCGAEGAACWQGQDGVAINGGGSSGDEVPVNMHVLVLGSDPAGMSECVDVG
ncbi:hypothetical protein [Cutibacterium sp. V947]|uniref:hypothetical protein n=1 Tax=Cutibacterium sp. V947 TaxID=3446480 RepID=UPI003EE35E4D